MRLIDADNINCEKLPRKLYPYLKEILDFIDSQDTVEGDAQLNNEAEFIEPMNNPDLPFG